MSSWISSRTIRRCLLNQVRLFDSAPEARNRVNTAFVFTNFVAGAIGSAAGAALYAFGGWLLVCAAGACVSVIALIVWIVARSSGAFAAVRRD